MFVATFNSVEMRCFSSTLLACFSRRPIVRSEIVIAINDIANKMPERGRAKNTIISVMTFLVGGMRTAGCTMFHTLPSQSPTYRFRNREIDMQTSDRIITRFVSPRE